MVLNENICSNLGKWLGVKCDIIPSSDSYVQVKCVDRGRTINGQMSIILHLAKESTVPNVLGANVVEEACVRQWIEYALLIMKLSNNSVMHRNMLQVLNETLSTRTYMVGKKRTLADVILYQALHCIMVNMTYGEKEQLMHLGRWFNFIQGDELVRQGKEMVLIGRPLS